MKKNLAKKIVMGLLTGAVLMSSSVVWAGQVAGHVVEGQSTWDGYKVVGGKVQEATFLGGSSSATGKNSVAVGYNSSSFGDCSIAIGANLIGTGSITSASGEGGIAIGASSLSGGAGSIAIGTGSNINSAGSVAIGANTKVVDALDSVALGSGSVANISGVVSVGSGSSNDAYGTRSIINVTDVSVSDLSDSAYGSYAVNVNTLNAALDGYYTKTEADGKFATKDYVENTFVKIQTTGEGDDKKTETQVTGTFSVVETVDNQVTTTTVTINADAEDKIVMDDEGITVGKNSSRMDGSGFYVWDGGEHTAANAKASMTKDGKVVAEQFIIKNGTDEINIKNELDKKASQSDLDTEKTERMAADQVLQTQIDNIGGGASDAIAGINQRLDKANAKINKVGAGAAALAALHPLEYDPDDKLTFSAGMGNYAGENAAALGAFYRPNEKFMVSLGGTMGNGENMVNLGLSIGLDKPNGYAKLSKRELIQKVNAMEAKYEAVEAEKEAMKAEMAEMKAMLQAILAKK